MLLRGVLLALLCLAGRMAPVWAASPNHERIISLAPSLTEMVQDLGAASLLVGRMAGGEKELAALPVDVAVAGGNGQVDFEQLLLLRPDLVLYWPGSIDQRQLARIEQLGIQVFHADAHTLNELGEQYERLGNLLGQVQRGREIRQHLEARLQALEQQYGQQPSLRYFYQIWHRPLFTLGGRQIVSEGLARCGLVNIFAQQPQAAFQTSYEAVLAGQPDLVLVVSRQLVDGWPSGMELPFIEISNRGLERPSLQMLAALEQTCATVDRFRGEHQ